LAIKWFFPKIGKLFLIGDEFIAKLRFGDQMMVKVKTMFS